MTSSVIPNQRTREEYKHITCRQVRLYMIDLKGNYLLSGMKFIMHVQNGTAQLGKFMTREKKRSSRPQSLL